MLDKLRAEALAIIAATPWCLLSTTGPAGVQASMVECVVHDGCVYALVPSTSDHLFNIEHDTQVVLTTAMWQLRGAALELQEADGRRGAAPRGLAQGAGRRGLTVVELFPLRMQIEPGVQKSYRETIDFYLSS
jgi:hypothetical protein